MPICKVDCSVSVFCKFKTELWTCSPFPPSNFNAVTSPPPPPTPQGENRSPTPKSSLNICTGVGGGGGGLHSPSPHLEHLSSQRFHVLTE